MEHGEKKGRKTKKLSKVGGESQQRRKEEDIELDRKINVVSGPIFGTWGRGTPRFQLRRRKKNFFFSGVQGGEKQRKNQKHKASVPLGAG